METCCSRMLSPSHNHLQSPGGSLPVSLINLSGYPETCELRKRDALLLRRSTAGQRNLSFLSKPSIVDFYRGACFLSVFSLCRAEKFLRLPGRCYSGGVVAFHGRHQYPQVEGRTIKAIFPVFPSRQRNSGRTNAQRAKRVSFALSDLEELYPVPFSKIT